jgi:sortase A
MNRNIKKFFVYVRMILLLMLLQAVVFYLAGVPLASYIKSIGSMAITKGAPAEPRDYVLNVSEFMKNSSIEDQSEIPIPVLETQYGTINCDRIALSAPLYYGDSDAVLEKGAGQYPLSGLPGEGIPILISSHDVTYFAPLEQIKIGDIITISTDYGDFEYKVNDTKIADKDDSTAFDLLQNKEQLILYTCYPFGQLIGERTDRFFVYCDRIPNITSGHE